MGPPPPVGVTINRRGRAADPHAPAARGGVGVPPPGPARAGAVRQLAVRRGDEQRAGLGHRPGAVRAVRRQLHDGRPLPCRLARRRRRGRRIRRVAQPHRRREGGVGVRRRRDHAVQPALLRQARVRGGAVQLDRVRRVRKGGERAGAAGVAAAVQAAAGAGHQAGDPHGAARGQEGGHGQQPRARRIHGLPQAHRQAAARAGAVAGVQVRRAQKAGGRRVHHRRQHRGPVDRHPRRAGGRPHLQAARPHVLRRLARVRSLPHPYALLKLCSYTHHPAATSRARPAPVFFFFFFLVGKIMHYDFFN